MRINTGPVTMFGTYAGLLVAAAGTALGVGSASGQMVWNGGSGVWSNPANWTPANVPNTGGETATISAVGAYTVFHDASFQVGAVALTNPDGLLAINNATTLGLFAGGLANDSRVTVNTSAGGSGTAIQALNSHAWTGTGSVVLNANAGNIETAILTWNGGGEVITQAATHSLLGSGRVYTFFVNNGTINANAAGRSLLLSNQAKTNNNLMTATNGGFLDVTTSIDQTGGGRIDASGGTVRFGGGSSVNGGHINVLAGGAGRTAASTTWTNTTVAGPFDISNATFLAASTSLTNNGTMTVNPGAGGSGTGVQLVNSVALDGAGTLFLNANAGNLETAIITWNGGGEVLTQAAAHTIRGSGRVYTFLTNNGNITADLNGRSLLLSNQTKANNNVMTATGGGFLDLACTVNQSALGRIQAANGTVRHTGATINGGLLSSTGTGLHHITGGSRWNSVSLSGPAAVENGTGLQLADALTNNGTITVNRTAGGTGTYLQTVNSMAVGGTGVIALNANSGGNLETAIITYNGGGEVMTLGANQVVRGTGRIYVNTVNNGLIHADISGRTLQLLSQPKQNNATMKASGGGTLNILSINVGQAGGAQILADGGDVTFTGATIGGGTVRSQNGGVSVIAATSRFSGVTSTGPLVVNNGVTLQIDANLTNNGSITVNQSAGGTATTVQALVSQNLTGTGEIVLNANTGGNLDTAYITYNGGGEVLTQAATHTIRGTGNIYVSMVNNGLIHADTNGRILQLLSQPKTNNATIKSSGGGILSVLNSTLSQAPAAQVLADGGEIRLSGATINGGQVNAVNGGLTTLTGSSTFNGVTVSGPFTINNSTVLGFNGGMVNNGIITVNTSAGASGTSMQCLATQSLSGSGAVVLNANVGGNLDTAYITYNGGAEVLTHAATHTIRGTGNIYVSLLNNGLVHANVSGKTLQLLSQPKTNNATMKATGGGILSISGFTLTQAPAAQLLADGGTVRISGATITDGHVDAVNGGLTQMINGSRFHSVTVSGPFETTNGTNMQVSGGLVNNGAITVNSVAGGSGTIMQFLASQTLSGTGAVYLNANSANFDTSYLTYSGGGEILTNDIGHTIGGKGRIYIRTNNNGIIAPGRPASPIGQIDLRGNGHLTFGPDAEFRCQIAGSGDANADRITGDKAIALDGALRILPILPFAPNRDDSWTIISGSSVTGAFSDVTSPAAVNGIGYKIEYYSNRVVLRAVCYADVNNDGGIDGSDVQAFFDLWEAGDPASDLNNDGGVDGADVAAFFDFWENGGC